MQVSVLVDGCTKKPSAVYIVYLGASGNDSSLKDASGSVLRSPGSMIEASGALITYCTDRLREATGDVGSSAYRAYI